MKRMFLSLDGIDGVGKSTQAIRLCEWLRTQGHEVVACRDPGGTKLGDALREIVLQQHDTPISPTSEMLLYMASRAQLVDEIIRPALATKKTVISDRFLLANVAYQGHAGGLGAETVWSVGAVATGGLMPRLTILLDMTAQQAADRRQETPDRMEARGIEYLERVRQGFLCEAQQRGDEIVVIDAGRDADAVQADIRSIAVRLLNDASSASNEATS